MYNEKNQDQTSVFDEWMANFFVDPNTSFLDFQAFRIDLFECDNRYLLEVLFENKPISQITISVSENKLTIFAKCVQGEQEPEILKRSVSFPFSLENRDISVELSSDAVFVSISKDIIEKGTSRLPLNLEVPY